VPDLVESESQEPYIPLPPSTSLPPGIVIIDNALFINFAVSSDPTNLYSPLTFTNGSMPTFTFSQNSGLVFNSVSSGHQGFGFNLKLDFNNPSITEIEFIANCAWTGSFYSSGTWFYPSLMTDSGITRYNYYGPAFDGSRLSLGSTTGVKMNSVDSTTLSNCKIKTTMNLVSNNIKVEVLNSSNEVQYTVSNPAVYNSAYPVGKPMIFEFIATNYSTVSQLIVKSISIKTTPIKLTLPLLTWSGRLS
jgi:hypothetical protein